VTQDQAVAAAGSLTGWQRDILAHCTISEPLKFNRYAKTGVPLWVWKNGKMGGALGRKCTRDYKINPVRQKVKRLAGVGRMEKESLVQQWIGISTDEAHRMKPSRDPWCENVWPLIDANMSRKVCLAWMKNRGYPEPPRSSCVFCPYHSADEWNRLQHDHDGYARAVAYEKKLSSAFSDWDGTLDGDGVFCQKIIPGVPLDRIDWSSVVNRTDLQLSMFGEWGNECEGMCGL
jgi:hypothetical protein